MLRAMEEERTLFAEEAAAYCGLVLSTWQGYRARNRTPAADGTVLEAGHARPVWKPSTLDAWMAQRPGRGSPGKPRGPRS